MCSSAKDTNRPSVLIAVSQTMSNCIAVIGHIFFNRQSDGSFFAWTKSFRTSNTGSWRKKMLCPAERKSLTGPTKRTPLPHKHWFGDTTLRYGMCDPQHGLWRMHTTTNLKHTISQTKKKKEMMKKKKSTSRHKNRNDRPNGNSSSIINVVSLVSTLNRMRSSQICLLHSSPPYTHAKRPKTPNRKQKKKKQNELWLR